MATRFSALAFGLIISVGGSVRGDDTILLRGKPDDAKAMTLKGSAETNAATIEVFHGRLLAALCHRPWSYAVPAYSYSYGCQGCCGGCYGCYGCYGGAGDGAGYAVPADYGSAVPSVAPAPSATAPALGRLRIPRAVPAAPPAGTSVARP